MKECDSLTRAIIEWQQSGAGFSKIMEQVSELVYNYPISRFYWSEDEAADFYCYFYDRMLRLIRTFQYQELSFRALLNNSLEWQMRTYYRRYWKRENRNGCVRYDCIIKAEEAWDSESGRPLSLTPQAVKLFEIDENGRINNEQMKKRILILTLKSAPFIDDFHIEAVKNLIGCDSLWLIETMHMLQQRAEARKNRFKAFCIRSNRAYIEICRIHRELEKCCSLAEKEVLLARLEKTKIKLEKATSGKASVKLVPTNYEIAEIMGMPKGSIDSCLFYIRKNLQPLSL